MTSAGFNRRMWRTAYPVVWKGCGAQSPQPNPISRQELLAGGKIDHLDLFALFTGFSFA